MSATPEALAENVTVAVETAVTKLDVSVRVILATCHCIKFANAAFAIQIIENKKPIAECIEIAKNSLYGKKALNALKKFVEINR